MTRTGYDSTNPEAIPAAANDPNAVVFGYSNGPLSQWPTSGWDRFPKARKIRYDVLGTNPYGADIGDLEPGNFGTPAEDTPAVWDELCAKGAAWVKLRQARKWWSGLYIEHAHLDQLRTACNGLPVLFGVADWNLNETEATKLLGGDIVSVQWASPSSNNLPGYDLSVVRDDWFPAIGTPVPPKLSGIVVFQGTGGLLTTKVASADGKNWA